MADAEHPTLDPDSMREAIIVMAVESWRFSRVFERVLTKLESKEQQRYKSQYRWFSKKVDDALELAGLHIVNVEQEQFSPGIAATPLNLDDFNHGEELVIDQMIEPIIMGNQGLVKTGTVTLRKKSV